MYHLVITNQLKELFTKFNLSYDHHCLLFLGSVIGEDKLFSYITKQYIKNYALKAKMNADEFIAALQELRKKTLEDEQFKKSYEQVLQELQRNKILV